MIQQDSDCDDSLETENCETQDDDFADLLEIFCESSFELNAISARLKEDGADSNIMRSHTAKGAKYQSRTNSSSPLPRGYISAFNTFIIEMRPTVLSHNPDLGVKIIVQPKVPN